MMFDCTAIMSSSKISNFSISKLLFLSGFKKTVFSFRFDNVFLTCNISYYNVILFEFCRRTVFLLLKRTYKIIRMMLLEIFVLFD